MQDFACHGCFTNISKERTFLTYQTFEYSNFRGIHRATEYGKILHQAVTDITVKYKQKTCNQSAVEEICFVTTPPLNPGHNGKVENPGQVFWYRAFSCTDPRISLVTYTTCTVSEVSL